MYVKEINWINQEPKLPGNFEVRIRYLHKNQKAKITKLEKDLLEVKFKDPQRAITAGQSAVFYKGKEVLGGGIISHRT